MRTTAVFTCNDWEALQPHVMEWLRQFELAVYLDSNGNRQDAYHKYDVLIGAGCHTSFKPEADTFAAIQWHWEQQPDWWMGYLTYDLKNELEALTSSHEDGMEWPKAGFFVPEIVIYLQGNALTISSYNIAPQVIWEALAATPRVAEWQPVAVEFVPRNTPEGYRKAVEALREHIAAGDIYEVNYTQEWRATGIQLDPYALFHAFDIEGKTPFASFMRWEKRWLLGQSPERFLAKRGDNLISQPIKGTTGRGKTTSEDEQLAAALRTNKKEQAENVMIVDLVRNDLARSAVTGSVTVPELFGIYRFPTVHQMISTVTAQLHPAVHWAMAIKHAFPMGSMTGAPKVSAMELIEQYEKSKRGLYSGAVGYIDPTGDFDFNVVIRSLQYRQPEGYLSFQTGGAITWGSDPKQEYAEALLKAAGIRRLFK